MMMMMMILVVDTGTRSVFIVTKAGEIKRDAE
jgi:hypothetical protein